MADSKSRQPLQILVKSVTLTQRSPARCARSSPEASSSRPNGKTGSDCGSITLSPRRRWAATRTGARTPGDRAAAPRDARGSPRRRYRVPQPPQAQPMPRPPGPRGDGQARRGLSRGSSQLGLYPGAQGRQWSPWEPQALMLVRQSCASATRKQPVSAGDNRTRRWCRNCLQTALTSQNPCSDEKGAYRNRTGVNGFAGRCVATPPRRRGRPQG